MLVLTLGIGGYLFSQQAKTEGPTSTTFQQDESQAVVAGAATSFQAAAPTLEAYYAANSSYVGASLPPSYGVSVVRADATSYCLQSADGQAHEVGPNGTSAAGPC
jgi:hypothetical protein